MRERVELVFTTVQPALLPNLGPEGHGLRNHLPHMGHAVRRSLACQDAHDGIGQEEDPHLSLGVGLQEGRSEPEGVVRHVRVVGCAAEDDQDASHGRLLRPPPRAGPLADTPRPPLSPLLSPASPGPTLGTGPKAEHDEACEEAAKVTEVGNAVTPEQAHEVAPHVGQQPQEEDGCAQ